MQRFLHMSTIYDYSVFIEWDYMIANSVYQDVRQLSAAFSLGLGC